MKAFIPVVLTVLGLTVQGVMRSPASRKAAAATPAAKVTAQQERTVCFGTLAATRQTGLGQMMTGAAFPIKRHAVIIGTGFR
ncbi:hypothetical protein N7532_005661 [Penicillium argentinense]|uniref:Uncharacterized protein n=1 Tax=Penicillium argentinense TaxID=1131581 RepID=A0A9W9FEB3_9EURO|nr:uncharacterized protein N7532_005661 [Penicillium argentinense]KAJ5098660.1 hypothetical protein N7532_005661 [Penicillium argentinense]